VHDPVGQAAAECLEDGAVGGWSADRNLAPRYMPMWTNEAKAEHMKSSPVLGGSLLESEVSL